jgi:cytochrome P450
MLSLETSFDLLGLVFSLTAFLVIRDYRRRRGLPYPPGPRPIPLIGNLFDIPKEFSWLEYTQLAKKYGMCSSPVLLRLTKWMTGDVLCLHVFGQVIVILSSVKATKDLLERRGDIYSDRPVIPIYEMYAVSEFGHSVMVADIMLRMRWEWVVPFARYTEFWRQARKVLDRGLRPGAVAAYRPVQQAKARALLFQLLTSPDDWETHLE